MDKFNVGTTLFVAKGGIGWRKIEGYTVEVVDRAEIVESGEYVEGLGLEAELFVVVPGLIFKDDEGEFTDLPEKYREVEFDVDTIWGIDGSGELSEYVEVNEMLVAENSTVSYKFDSITELGAFCQMNNEAYEKKICVVGHTENGEWDILKEIQSI